MAAFPNTRALFKKREKLEALIEAAIDCLDSLDGDPDLEWSVGLDEREWDFAENEGDAFEDEFPRPPKSISRRQASAIRRKVEAQLRAVEMRKSTYQIAEIIKRKNYA